MSVGDPDHFLRALRDLGVPYRERPGWRTRGGTLDARGATLHQSVTGSMSDDRACDYCAGSGGRGLLYGTMLGRQRDVAYLLGWGPANHAGQTNAHRTSMARGSGMPLDRDMGLPAAGDDYARANHELRALAWITSGGEPPTAWQRWAAPRVLAAMCLAHGWGPDEGARAVCSHEELTRRKPGDPAVDMGAIRREVRDLLSSRAGKTAPPPPSKTPDPQEDDMPYSEKELAAIVRGAVTDVLTETRARPKALPGQTGTTSYSAALLYGAQGAYRAEAAAAATAGEVAGLRAAVQALAAGGGVDLAAVEEAGRRGVRRAFAELGRSAEDTEEEQA